MLTVQAAQSTKLRDSVVPFSSSQLGKAVGVPYHLVIGLFVSCLLTHVVLYFQESNEAMPQDMDWNDDAFLNVRINYQSNGASGRTLHVYANK